MFAYIVRKTIFSIVVLFFSSIVIFGLVALGPDPLTELKLNPRVTQADIERISAQYGLDQPLPIPYGIYSAIKKYSALDNAGTFLSFVGYSMPTFWLGLILQLVLGVYLTSWA